MDIMEGNELQRDIQGQDEVQDAAVSDDEIEPPHSPSII